MRRMAAAPSPARTRPRSTARPPMRRAISPRTSWRRASPSAAPSRSPTRSASPIRCRCWSTPTAPARSTSASSRRCCREMFRLTPTNIRRTLKLNKPIYRRTAAYGHFGRAPDKDGGFSWETHRSGGAAQERVLSARQQSRPARMAGLARPFSFGAVDSMTRLSDDAEPSARRILRPAQGPSAARAAGGAVRDAAAAPRGRCRAQPAPDNLGSAVSLSPSTTSISKSASAAPST